MKTRTKNLISLVLLSSCLTAMVGCNTQGKGKASDCIKCGKCEKICPQHLEIRNLLTKVSETFE